MDFGVASSLCFFKIIFFDYDINWHSINLIFNVINFVDARGLKIELQFKSLNRTQKKVVKIEPPNS